MANTSLTHLMVAREAAKILTEESPFVSGVNKGRQEEFGEAVSGYGKGDTVKIKLPSIGKVFDGAVFAESGAATDNVEQSINLTLDTQKHVALQFGTKEKMLEMPEFKERVLRPQMRMLASVIEADLMLKAARLVPNFVGTAGTTPTAMKTYAQARAKLEAYLAPPSDRSAIISSNANVELVDASKALFSARAQIERGFLRGTIGEAQGADFYEHQSIPSLTNGNKVAGLTVSGAGQSGSSLLIAGTANLDTFKVGQVFTIADVYSVHPLTGAATTTLQQFVVTADVTASTTTATIGIYPAIKATAPNKTVSALPASGAALVFVGAASTAYANSLMFQKDAFTAAFAPLPVIASCEGYTARLPNGISVRVMTFGDGNNDYERTRIDVLYGFAGVRPLHAVRLPG